MKIPNWIISVDKKTEEASNFLNKNALLCTSIAVVASGLLGLLTGSLLFMTVSVGVACLSKVALSKSQCLNKLLEKVPSQIRNLTKNLVEFAIALCAGMQLAFFAQFAIGAVAFSPIFLPLHLIGTASLCLVLWAFFKGSAGFWEKLGKKCSGC